MSSKRQFKNYLLLGSYAQPGAVFGFILPYRTSSQIALLRLVIQTDILTLLSILVVLTKIKMQVTRQTTANKSLLCLSPSELPINRLPTKMTCWMLSSIPKSSPVRKCKLVRESSDLVKDLIANDGYTFDRGKNEEAWTTVLGSSPQ